MKINIDLSTSRAKSDYKLGVKINVSDTMQTGYSYVLKAQYGVDFADDFKPELTPAEILAYGVFEGKYLNDCYTEFPREWFESAMKLGKLSPEKPNTEVNHFKIKSRQSLSVWQQKGWITKDDPDVRGWFQWYCRYYIGRREPVLDERQIKRWRAFKRHAAQVHQNCETGNLLCRPRQRQALLQWAYNPFI